MVVVLVTGCSGTIGSGIAAQYLKAGAKVIAPLRSEKSKAVLEGLLGTTPADKLEVIITDVSTDAGAKALAGEVEARFGKLDHVVSSVGGWWQKGELTEQSVEEVRETIETYAVSHFLVFKYLSPLLKDAASSSYTFISGAAGGYYVPQASLVSVGQSALFGVSVAARGEFANKAPRVNELRINALIKPDTEADPSAGTYPTSRIGSKVLELGASDVKGQVVAIGSTDLQ